MGSTGRARVAGALLVMVAAAGAGQAMAQPIPPDDGQAAGTNAPPPPPDDGWDPGEPPEAQNVPPRANKDSGTTSSLSGTAILDALALAQHCFDSYGNPEPTLSDMIEESPRLRFTKSVRDRKKDHLPDLENVAEDRVDLVRP